MKIAFIIIIALVVIVLFADLLNVGAVFAYLQTLDFLPSFIQTMIGVLASVFTTLNEYPVIILMLLFFAIPLFLRVLAETFLGGKQE